MRIDKLNRENSPLSDQKLRSLLQDKLNRFYILAFAPLLPLLVYRYTAFNDPLGVLVPFYGFLILLMKKDKLTKYNVNPSFLQETLGVLFIAVSFLVYYAIAPFIFGVGFYGIVNYTIYLFGLVLFFFKLPAFKETFTAFFLIISIGIIGLSYNWIERQITPTVPYYVSIFSSVLSLFGVSHTRPNPYTLFLNTPRGLLPVWFEGGCIGIYSVVIFSILIVVTMVETLAPKRTKLVWTVFGLVGVFVLNIVRLLIVIASMFAYGWDFGQQVHQVIGYVLFLSWLTLFLFLFSQRQTIAQKLHITTQPAT
jgi:exosortase/archaeosortase family protein